MAENFKYGFRAHLSSEFPSQIIVDVTEFCNLECIHCPHDEFTRSGFFKGRHLDLGLHKKLIDEVATDGKDVCKYLRYTAQGDPLLHPGFVEMIKYAALNSETSINITTNGVALTEKKAKALLDAGVDVFDISIDAYSEETYARVRKKGDLKVTRSNVLKLIDLIQKESYRCKVVVSFVEQPLNKHETADFEKYWNDKGADYVVIRRMHSCAGANDEIAQQMREKNKLRKPCLYPWERLVLSSTGQVGFCPADWKYEAKITSFEDNTIKEIWQSEFMQKLREAHLNNDFSDFSFCGQCPDWAAMRWPDEGRSYSDMMQEFKQPDLAGNK